MPWIRRRPAEAARLDKARIGLEMDSYYFTPLA